MTQVPYPASAGAPDVRGLAEGAHMPRPCKNDAPACRGAGTSTREGKMRLARSRPAQEDHPDGAGTGQVSHAGGALLVTCRPGRAHWGAVRGDGPDARAPLGARLGGRPARPGGDARRRAATAWRTSARRATAPTCSEASPRGDRLPGERRDRRAVPWAPARGGGRRARSGVRPQRRGKRPGCTPGNSAPMAGQLCGARMVSGARCPTRQEARALR